MKVEVVIVEIVVFGLNIFMFLIFGLVIKSSCFENFIGIYYFLFVDKMFLVEIIMGEKIFVFVFVKSFDYVKKIKKILIVVNDSCGFYMFWCFGIYV